MAQLDSVSEGIDSSNKRLMFVVSEDWYFASHRLDLARAAVAEGWEVSVACRVSESCDLIVRAGVAVRNWEMPRGSLNPIKLGRAIISLRRDIREFAPSHIHAVSIFTVVVARAALLGIPNTTLISTVAGLGRLTSRNVVAKFVLSAGLRLVALWLTQSRANSLVVQNIDDFQALGGDRNPRIRLIPGSGVDPTEFPKANPRTTSPITVALVARMIRDKGIVEFVEAIDLLTAEGIPLAGLLVGKPDPGNPHSLSKKELTDLTLNSAVTWLGPRNDISEIITQANIICLPTYYGEGIPRILLEAGCVGRPVVSCDVPGPRDLVRNGIDGVLVAPKSSKALAQALKNLAADPELRATMGNSLHQRVIGEFSNDKVLYEYMSLYTKGLHHQP